MSDDSNRKQCSRETDGGSPVGNLPALAGRGGQRKMWLKISVVPPLHFFTQHAQEKRTKYRLQSNNEQRKR